MTHQLVDVVSVNFMPLRRQSQIAIGLHLAKLILTCNLFA